MIIVRLLVLVTVSLVLAEGEHERVVTADPQVLCGASTLCSLAKCSPDSSPDAPAEPAPPPGAPRLHLVSYAAAPVAAVLLPAPRGAYGRLYSGVSPPSLRV